jgi:hypothetical protein
VVAQPVAVEVVGQSRVNRSDLAGLRWAWSHRRLVLFLGAGVSLEWGIPGWKNLVLELLFEQTAEARRLRGLWPHYRRALAEWVTDYFDYDPVILARMVKTDLRQRAVRAGDDGAEQRFLADVRQHLYAGYEKVRPRLQPSARRGGTTLGAVADLVGRSSGTRGVAAVVTFNFDDLLERELTARRIPHYTVASGVRTHAQGMPVVHPHGFLPHDGPLPADGIVFTEDDYHRLTDSMFHWALTTIVSYLRQYTVLFLGLSMSDPNLRRLLDASRYRGERPAHWQVQKRHQVRDRERTQVVANVDERARRHGRILGDQELKDKTQILEAIDAMLRQADSYDRELFETMGVKTIWLEDYPDIPALLREVPRLQRARAPRRSSA